MNYFLFMPYYKFGSLVQYEPENLEQIISLINQVLAATYLAFQKLGFLHNDLHIGNILVFIKNNNIVINVEIIINV